MSLSPMELFTVSMPAMRKHIIILGAILLLAGKVQAQEKKYIYQDTTIKTEVDPPVIVEEAPAEDVIAAPVEEDNSPVFEETLYADTSLYYKQLWVSEDTIRYWKNMPAFGYAAYLDSLLRKRQLEFEKQQKKRKQHNSNNKSSSGESDDAAGDMVTSSSALFSSPALNVILWVLAGAFILFILYSLFLKDGVFRRKSKAIAGMGTADAETEEVKPGTNMDSLIAQAVKDKNYRLAVRYQYLKNLHKLAEKGLLQYAVDKTNYQYVQELGNAALRNEFAGVTLNYEYVWYGEFEIDETIYRKMEAGFTILYNKI